MSAAVPDSFATACAALRTGLARPDREVATVGQFDPDWRLLGSRHVVGGASRLLLPVRTVVADALAFGSANIVLAHAHPSGDPRPSASDIAYTRLLGRTLAAIDVRLVDHLIVAPDGFVSLRAIGLL